MTYRNPVLKGFYPDPSICRVGEDYYLVTSSFEYFPGVPLFHSRDLVHWEQIGHCLTRKSQLNLDKAGASGGIYAPALRFHAGRFYMITTNVSHKGHFYVYTDAIRGEWSEPVFIEGHYTGHDPDLFFDHDGKVYYTRFSWDQGILLYEIDLKTGRLLTEGRSIWKGFEDRLPEAPHLYRINGFYYLLAAEGGTWNGHMAVVARSRHVEGPYESCPYNPILSHRALVMQPLAATGHADLVQTPEGNWWMVFLGIRRLVEDNYHTLGRETFLAPVTWTEDGWPLVNGGKPVSFEMDGQGLPMAAQNALLEEKLLTEQEEKEPVPELCHKAPGLHWNTRYNPPEKGISFDANLGCLTLSGTKAALSDGQNVSMLCRRQQHRDFTCTVNLAFEPQKDGEEAGLCVIMNELHHYEIALRFMEGGKHLIVRRRIGDLESLVYSRPYSSESIYLSLSGDAQYYSFGEGSAADPLTRGMARYLSTEVAGGFTGVYIGLYATGSGRESTVPAFFSHFQYRGKD